MRRAGGDGLQSARHFVLALCAAFEGGVAMGQTPGDGLVIARVEVQGRNVGDGAPVATVGDAALRVEQDERTGHGLAVSFGDKQQAVLGHLGADGLKKCAIQVGIGAVQGVGRLIAASEKIPVRFGDFCPDKGAETNSGIAYLALLLFDLFAFIVP